eukprot:9495466-Pyramimonas_sp.AAC.2
MLEHAVWMEKVYDKLRMLSSRQPQSEVDHIYPDVFKLIDEKFARFEKTDKTARHLEKGEAPCEAGSAGKKLRGAKHPKKKVAKK